jgi:hypothetical protein
MRSSGLILQTCKNAGLALALLAASAAGAADSRVVPDTFTAKTAAMTPADVAIKIDVREWSSAEARADVVAALAAEDAPAGLKDLPTVGFAWHAGSSVGYSIKYAHRDGDRVTLVTERQIGAFGNKPWTATGGGTDVERKYSVVELDVAAGTGNLSIAADVKLDEAAGTVSLTPKPGAAPALTSVKQEPKPYWLR